MAALIRWMLPLLVALSSIATPDCQTTPLTDIISQDDQKTLDLTGRLQDLIPIMCGTGAAALCPSTSCELDLFLGNVSVSIFYSAAPAELNEKSDFSQCSAAMGDIINKCLSTSGGSEHIGGFFFNILLDKVQLIPDGETFYFQGGSIVEDDTPGDPPGGPDDTASSTTPPASQATGLTNLNCYEGDQSPPRRSFSGADAVQYISTFCSEYARSSFPNTLYKAYPPDGNLGGGLANHVEIAALAPNGCTDPNPKTNLEMECNTGVKAVLDNCDSGSGTKWGGSGDWKCMKYKINGLIDTELGTLDSTF